MTDTLALTLNQKFETAYYTIDKIAKCAYDLNTLTLEVIAGSIIVILGSDYVKPVKSKAKLIYLLFVPSWVALSASIYYEYRVDEIASRIRRFIHYEDLKYFLTGEDGIDALYRKQALFFSVGVSIISLWLVSYLLWWIFSKNEKE